MKRPGSLRSRSAPVRHTPIRGGQIKRKKRTPSEFARVYGSKARVAWIKAQPCVSCGRTPCDNAHIESDGMGRKADCTKIVPLCSKAEDRRVESIVIETPGCHAALHQMGRVSFEWFRCVNLATEAERIENLWLAHLRQTGRARREETDER